MKKLALIALAVLAMLALASPASARGRDGNHDGLPDRWEKHHKLSLKVKQAKRDQDSDGLNNRGEFRAKTNPRDDDTDDDGVEDGNEQAGTIKSFENGVLTITLAQGGDLSATVDDETEIECHGKGDLKRARSSHEGDDDGPNHDAGDDHGGNGDDEQGDDEQGDDDHGDDHGDFEHGDDENEDGDDGNEHGDDDDDRCGADALKAGTKVHEAELEITSKGKHWEELELLSA